MLLSFALIFLSGLLLGWLCSKIKLPPLVGMLIAGIIIGPHCLALLDESVLNISAQLRQIALVIILLRAGLNLKAADLKKVGRPAILMCFVPALFEIAGMLLLATKLLKLSVIDALILGTVIAAVSPAVIVPHMLKIMDEGYGTKEGIPQMILAGASADDVFVIVLFTSFVNMKQSGSFDAVSLVRIPTSILLGIAAGALLGLLFHFVLKKLELGTVKTIILFMCCAFLLTALEAVATGTVGFSGLIATMTMGMAFAGKSGEKAAKLSAGLSKLWIPAEILLFVLVGAAVDVQYALKAGGLAIAVILGALLFRMLGVFFCLLGTEFSIRERLFSMLAYTPKATVQAAIGAIPLTLGFSCGNTVLTVAVVAILITAPVGAFLIDLTYKRLLKPAQNAEQPANPVPEQAAQK